MTRSITLKTLLNILPVIGSRRLSQSYCSSYCICLFTDRVRIDYHLTLMHKLCVSPARIALVCHSFMSPPAHTPLSGAFGLPFFVIGSSPQSLTSFLFVGVIAPYTMLALCAVSPSLVQPSHWLTAFPRRCLKMMF